MQIQPGFLLKVPGATAHGQATAATKQKALTLAFFSPSPLKVQAAFSECEGEKLSKAMVS